MWQIKIDMSFTELLLAAIGLILSMISLMLAIAEWNRSIKRITTINSWGESTVDPYIEGGEPYIATRIFNKERHYRIKSIRITGYSIDEINLKKILFRIEDQNGWLVPNFVFDEKVSHDVKISSDVERKIWSLRATIGSDGFGQLKLVCYNRTGKPFRIRFEPLLEHTFTVGDAIHWFFITWFPTLSKPIILISDKIGGIITLSKTRIQLLKPSIK